MRNRTFIFILVALTSACIHINRADEFIFKDPQVAMVMRIANLSQVREGSIAREKAAEPSVRDFANMMTNEHGAANSRMETALAEEYVSSMDSPLSRQLDAESGRITDELRNLSGRAFDRAYMQRQVDVHQKMLTIIDTQLMPVVKEKVLKQWLTEARPKIEEHLAKAKQILASLPAA